MPVGTNLFGLLPGVNWGTDRDRIFIVGAHWDTFGESGGMNDNG